MSATLQQIFALNPTAVINDTDLFYLVQSPYTPGTDAGITGANLKAALGVGNVNPGLINQLGYYAAAGSTISGLATANNGVLVTSAGGVPSISSTLPAAVQGNITSLGTLSTPLSPVSGGTGVNNGTNTLTLAGSLATVGAFGVIFNFSALTNVTFPTSGTLATTGGTITNANNINVTDDTTTNASMFPLWVTANTGFLPAKVSSTKLSFNPSTATLTTTTFAGALSGNATTATTATNANNVAVTDDTTTNANMFPAWFTANTGNLPAKVSSTKITFNPSTATLTTTTFAGSLSGNATTATTATNSNNSAITDDTTTNATMDVVWVTTNTGNLPLKTSSSKLTWNPSTGTLSATTFSGSFSGTVTNATNIAITDDTTTNANMFPVWVTANTGNLPAKVSSTKITFNPSTATLTTTTFVGALTGNASSATTATTATNATNTAITDDTTTNANMFLTWVTANTGNLPQKVSSTNLTFNPSTGTLTTTTFVGALTGNATNVTGVVTGAHGGTGVNNGTSTITLGGNLTTSGAFATTFTMTAATSVTFPTSGTLATTSQIPALPLSLTNGGTNASLAASNGGILYSTASAFAVLAGTATANQVILSGLSTTPAWSTATYPATTTINQILYSSAANTITGLATANSGVLVTNSSGVPSIAVGQIPGIASNTAANAGTIGEYISSVVASGSAVSLSNGIAKTVTSIVLTAGDWDVWGELYTTGGATTQITIIQANISTATNTIQAGPADGNAYTYDVAGSTTTSVGIIWTPGGTTVPFLPLAPCRQLVNTNTTMYLVAQVSFSISTCSAYGKICARRVR